MSSKRRFTLPGNLILKKRSDIEKVLTKGKRIPGKIFNVFICSSEKTRVAFLISKRIGKAVMRNRMKRLFREGYRLNRHKFENKEVIFIINKFQDDFHLVRDQIKSIAEHEINIDCHH